MSKNKHHKKDKQYDSDLDSEYESNYKKNANHNVITVNPDHRVSLGQKDLPAKKVQPVQLAQKPLCRHYHIITIT